MSTTKPLTPQVWPWEESQILKDWAGRGEELWENLELLSTPIHRDDGWRSTFFFRSNAPAVHLRINRLTDKQNMVKGMMTRIPDTDVWVKTLDTGSLLRASYGFSELNVAITPPPVPPEFDTFALNVDPHNLLPVVVDAGQGKGLSLLAGTRANTELDNYLWGDSQAEEITHTLIQRGQRYIYLPPGWTSEHKLPVMIISDGDQWFGRYKLAQALDRAIEREVIPPVAVCAEGFNSRSHRLTSLKANVDFLHYLIEENLSWLRDYLATNNVEIGKVVVAGQSLGAWTALWGLGTSYAKYFDAVIAQSPSLWFSPEHNASPTAMTGLESSWIQRRLVARGSCDIPLFIEVGLREQYSVLAVSRFVSELKDHGWNVHFSVVDGGHDYASWRYGLITQLGRAFRELSEEN